MMHTRREILQSSALGTAIGIGVLASSSTATATGASFGDGVNLQPAYYCDGDQDLGWDLMAQYSDIQTLRIEIEPPSEGESQAEIEDAKRWLDEADSQGYDVIATYHHHPNNGSSESQDLQAAADWWVEHYDYLSRDASFTINLMNEWGDHSVDATQYASAYDEAISTVRNGTSYSGSIVIDAPGWGGNTHVAADAASNIDDDDIVLSAHVYPSGWNETVGEYIAPEHLDVLEETDRPCLIGEFGDTGDGEGDWSAVIDYANSMGWPVLGWAWNGDGEELNMVSPAWTDGCNGPYSESSYFETIYGKLGSGSDDGGSDPQPDPDPDPGPEPDPEPDPEPEPEPEPDPDDTIAQFDPSTASVAVGDRITFQVEDTSGSGRWITDLEWDFGDGTTDSGWWTEHRYSESGSYTITLTATDNEGASTSYDVTVTVT